MDNLEIEFLKRLLQTFTLEADERLHVIGQHLVELETASDLSTQMTATEATFREFHSLKGAARSVNFTAIEKLCQECESVLELVKKKKVPLDKRVFDGLHDALEQVTRLLPQGTSAPLTSQDMALISRLRALQDVAPISEPVPIPAVETQPEEPAGIPVSFSSLFQLVQPEEPEPVSAPPFIEVPLPPVVELIAPPAVTVPPPPPVTLPGAARAPESPVIATGSRAETVRLPKYRLEQVLIQAEEMVLVKQMLNHQLRTLKRLTGNLGTTIRTLNQSGAPFPSSSTASDELEQLTALQTELEDFATQTAADSSLVHRLTDDLLNGLKHLFLVPLSLVFESVPKIVRDLARSLGKDVDLQLQVGEIEIDRRISEEMRDPMIHLLRNALDHGLELPELRQQRGKPSRGSLRVIATQIEGNKVVIEVIDDGEGIDPGKVRVACLKAGIRTEQEIAQLSDQEIIQFIFQSGVSTSPIITDLSGRGLGMAIVRDKIERLGGDIQVDSVPGQGTTLRIILPLTVATVRGIVVNEAGRTYILPTLTVENVVRAAQSEITLVNDRLVWRFQGQVLPFLRLADVLEVKSNPRFLAAVETVSLVVLRSGPWLVALGVDEIVSEQEILLKGLGKQLRRVRNVSGVAILGNGELVPVLNTADLVKSTIRLGRHRRQAMETAPGSQTHQKKILIADDSLTSRMLLKNMVESSEYQVTTAVDGQDAFEKLMTSDFDLLISDVEMPRLDGFGLVQRVRAEGRFQHFPVILVTGLASREDRERGVEVGADAYFVKSNFEQSNLLDVIRRLL